MDEGQNVTFDRGRPGVVLLGYGLRRFLTDDEETRMDDRKGCVMMLTMRPYGGEADYWRIRGFLREVFLLNGRRERSWSLVRFDYWRWHIHENIERFRLDEVIFIWEGERGEIGAVLNADRKGEGFLQVHPAFHSRGLDEEMIVTAEERLAVVGEDGRRSLRLWVGEEEWQRKGILRQRGYVRQDWPEYQRRRPLVEPVPDVPVAAGYVVRPLGDVDELPARSWLSWLAFHPDEPAENYQGWAWYPNVQRAPLYRRDLDIVAVAPDGELAAFCTVWFDDVTRTGTFEPVGTAPAHQRKGLGKAVMAEGLRRVQRLGATLAMVGSYSAGAGALYHSMGFVEYDLSEPWVKVWEG